MTQENCPIGWTIDAYVSHNEALREAEEKFQAERDRRYAEVREEQEKAIKIKEQARPGRTRPGAADTNL